VVPVFAQQYFVGRRGDEQQREDPGRRRHAGEHGGQRASS